VPNYDDRIGITSIRSSVLRNISNRLVPLLIGGTLLAGQFPAIATGADGTPGLVQPLSVKRVVSNGRHNAFAAFAKWKNNYWLCFRSGTGHGSTDGDIVVLRSSDTKAWTEVMRQDVQGDDRDPQLLATPKRLFLYTNSRDSGFRVFANHTDDGQHWSKPQPVYKNGFILWKPLTHGGKFYAAAHRPGPNNRRHADLVTSTDGIDWKLASTIRAGQGESETTLHFLDGNRLVGFLRSQVTVGGFLMESAPPYTKWTQRPAGHHLSGQSAYTFAGVTYMISRELRYTPPVPPSTLRVNVASRVSQATMVFTFQDGKLTPYCRLGPLQGNHDSSYATAVQVGNEMLVVYHRSAHEYSGATRLKDAAELFLARVPLKTPQR